MAVRASRKGKSKRIFRRKNRPAPKRVTRKVRRHMKGKRMSGFMDRVKKMFNYTGVSPEMKAQQEVANNAYAKAKTSMDNALNQLNQNLESKNSKNMPTM